MRGLTGGDLLICDTSALRVEYTLLEELVPSWHVQEASWLSTWKSIIWSLRPACSLQERILIKYFTSHLIG